MIRKDTTTHLEFKNLDKISIGNLPDSCRNLSLRTTNMNLMVMQEQVSGHYRRNTAHVFQFSVNLYTFELNSEQINH